MMAGLRRSLASVARMEQGPLPVLALVTAVAFFLLLQMGVLQSWMEVTRLTLIAWILLAITTKEYESRSPQPA
jgi:hypothetical protein